MGGCSGRVFVCFLLSLPVPVGTMNYASVILVGLFAIITDFWFMIGNKFKGPKIDWDELNTLAQMKNT